MVQADDFEFLLFGLKLLSVNPLLLDDSVVKLLIFKFNVAEVLSNIVSFFEKLKLEGVGLLSDKV